MLAYTRAYFAVKFHSQMGFDCPVKTTSLPCVVHRDLLASDAAIAGAR